MDVVAKNREVAYAMTKVESNDWFMQKAQPMDLMPLVCPCYVIGPLLAAGL